MLRANLLWVSTAAGAGRSLWTLISQWLHLVSRHRPGTRRMVTNNRARFTTARLDYP